MTSQLWQRGRRRPLTHPTTEISVQTRDAMGEWRIGKAYTEFMSHWRVDQPISGKDDVCLSCDRLRQLQQLACSLGQALRGQKDGFLQFLG